MKSGCLMMRDPFFLPRRVVPPPVTRVSFGLMYERSRLLERKTPKLFTEVEIDTVYNMNPSVTLSP